MSVSEKIVVTGATGQFGRLVVAALLEKIPPTQIVGVVRNVSAARDLAERGIELRAASYENVPALDAALTGATKVLLISSSEVGHRAQQHHNVIEAAKRAGVKLLAYTSILHADKNAMALATEHLTTEKEIRASGLPYALLRNSWYTENYTGRIAAALQTGTVLGAAKSGRISAAARADYAAAAAAVLTSAENQAGKVYELAGDNAFTVADYAAEIAKQSGKSIVYQDMPEAQYKAALIANGLPEPYAAALADSDAKIAEGVLYDASKQLSKLIGRPTTTLVQSVAAAFKQRSSAR
jgi:NAD(P)H dehydrogenase (quinone)